MVGGEKRGVDSRDEGKHRPLLEGTICLSRCNSGGTALKQCGQYHVHSRGTRLNRRVSFDVCT